MLVDYNTYSNGSNKSTFQFRTKVWVYIANKKTKSTLGHWNSTLSHIWFNMSLSFILHYNFPNCHFPLSLSSITNNCYITIVKHVQRKHAVMEGKRTGCTQNKTLHHKRRMLW